ncbi:hypothetical protein CEB40_00370 [Lactiplantibacillus plantarum]|nr:hypothetical protein CEB40_00370 [Lactiplantibacillus plantarum]
MDSCSSAMRVRFRPPGLGDNCWNVSRRRLEPVHKPPGLKYESYSKPEATHFRLRIIWLLSIVTQLLQSVSRSNG